MPLKCTYMHISQYKKTTLGTKAWTKTEIITQSKSSFVSMKDISSELNPSTSQTTKTSTFCWKTITAAVAWNWHTHLSTDTCLFLVTGSECVSEELIFLFGLDAFNIMWLWSTYLEICTIIRSNVNRDSFCQKERQENMTENNSFSSSPATFLVWHN